MLSVEELNDLRQKVLAGVEFPPEEYKRIIQAYRATRLGAVTAGAEKTKAKVVSAAKAAPVDLGTLFASIGLQKKE